MKLDKSHPQWHSSVATKNVWEMSIFYDCIRDNPRTEYFRRRQLIWTNWGLKKMAFVFKHFHIHFLLKFWIPLKYVQLPSVPVVTWRWNEDKALPGTMIIKLRGGIWRHKASVSSSVCNITLRPKQYGRHFADDIFKWIFANENVWIPIKISLKFVAKFWV